MNKTIGIILILLFCVTLFGAEVKNQDKPLKGTWDFNLKKMWGVSSAGEEPLVRVRQFRVDDAGNIYLFEGKYLKFFVFNPDGKLLFSFGKKGEGPGELKFPFNFFIEGGYIIVPDMGRIHYFEKKDGKFVKAVVLETMMGLMPRSFIDKDRFITVPENPEGKGSQSTITIYDTNTKKRETLTQIGAERPMDLTGNRGGARIRLRIIDPSTRPGVVTAFKNNKLYLGKSDNYMIKAVDLKGTEVLSFSLEGRERRKITEAFKKSRVENMRLNGQKLPPEMAKQMMANIPDYATYFRQLMVDEKGYIYVFVSDLGNRNSQEIDIFSPKGEYLYHSVVSFPEGYSMQTGLVIKKGYLYAVLEDEEGEIQLVKYRIKEI
jgi:hypothetical protein